MDAETFDRLARSLTAGRTRRGLLTRLLATLPLGSALLTGGVEEAAAQPPLERLQQRTQQRNRKQRNNTQNHNKTKNNRKNKNTGGGQGGRTSGAPVCTPTCPSFTVGQCAGGCLCVQSVEGDPFCIQLANDNCQVMCTSSSECGGGFCAIAACCSGSPGTGFTACIPAANICAS